MKKEDKEFLDRVVVLLRPAIQEMSWYVNQHPELFIDEELFNGKFAAVSMFFTWAIDCDCRVHYDRNGSKYMVARPRSLSVDFGNYNKPGYLNVYKLYCPNTMSVKAAGEEREHYDAHSSEHSDVIKWLPMHEPLRLYINDMKEKEEERDNG